MILSTPTPIHQAIGWAKETLVVMGAETDPEKEFPVELSMRVEQPVGVDLLVAKVDQVLRVQAGWFMVLRDWMYYWEDPGAGSET